MNSPKLSIIVPVHNSQETLEECLSAISRSDYRDYELIIVDDGSTDNSVDIAKHFKCRIIRLETNKGAAVARNYGVQEAKNEIVLFIDSDVIIKQDSISKIISIFLENNNLTGVVGVYSIENRFLNFLSQYKHIVVCYREKGCKNVNQNSFKACFFAIKKEILNKYKFDEFFKKASIEDIEFGRRLISLGHKLIIDKLNDVEHVKKFTVKTFFKNQFNRSKEIFKICLDKEARQFYYGIQRENQYAKLYILRVPISWTAVFLLVLFLIIHNYIVFLCLAFLLLISVFIEKDFLKFCFEQKGFIFTMKCILFYFYDGFISGLGVMKGAIEKYTGKK